MRQRLRYDTSVVWPASDLFVTAQTTMSGSTDLWRASHLVFGCCRETPELRSAIAQPSDATEQAPTVARAIGLTVEPAHSARVDPREARSDPPFLYSSNSERSRQGDGGAAEGGAAVLTQKR